MVDTKLFVDWRENYWRKSRKYKDLDVHHLVNILNWVIARPSVYNNLEYLKMEADSRRLLLFVSHDSDVLPIESSPNVWQVIDRVTGEVRNANTETIYDDDLY